MSFDRTLVAKCVIALAVALASAGCGAAARPMTSPRSSDMAKQTEAVAADATVTPTAPTTATVPSDSPHEQPPPPSPTEDDAAKAYDRGDIDKAKTIADTVLATDPNNVRMLRLAVSASCINNHAVEAQKYYARLVPSGRNFMKSRCARYGVVLTDP